MSVNRAQRGAGEGGILSKREFEGGLRFFPNLLDARVGVKARQQGHDVGNRGGFRPTER